MLLCERFHWTLGEVDAMDMLELAETHAILRALDLARRPSGGN